MRDLIQQHEDIEHERRIEVRKWQALTVCLLLLLLVGAIGWRVAGQKQDQAATNAQVAQAGVALADQLNGLCKSSDPAAKAFAKKYKICEQVQDVKELAPSINAQTLATPVPVQTVILPGRPGETVTAWATLPARTTTATSVVTEAGARVTVPGPIVTQPVPFPTTVTQTIPGPTVTQTVDDTRIQYVTETMAGEPVFITETVTEPPVTQTVTSTVAITAVPSTSFSTVTESVPVMVPGPTTTATVTVTVTPPPPTVPTDSGTPTIAVTP